MVVSSFNSRSRSAKALFEVGPPALPRTLGNPSALFIEEGLTRLHRPSSVCNRKATEKKRSPNCNLPFPSSAIFEKRLSQPHSFQRLIKALSTIVRGSCRHQTPQSQTPSYSRTREPNAFSAAPMSPHPACRRQGGRCYPTESVLSGIGASTCRAGFFERRYQKNSRSPFSTRA